MRLRRFWFLAFAVVLVACGSDSDQTSPTTAPGAPTSSTGDDTGSTPQEESGEATLTTIADLNSITALAAHPETGELYVAEREGLVVVVNPDDGSVSDPLIDISDEVSTEGERGLLGVAISPDADAIYLSYNDLDGATVIDRFGLESDGSVDVSGRAEVFTLDQPFSNHNGGNIGFGPDGFLYLGLGDGGGAGDPLDTGQDPEVLLGTLIRIDPDTDGGYSIPSDNPFVAGGGAPEVWLFGARNPWRFSWDRATGDLWIGDVGQDEVEEIDLLPAPDAGRGANLGWSEMEGSQPFEGGTEPVDHVGPVFDYARVDPNCSVTGGYVYRGENLPWLDGVYLYGDFCAGDILGLTVDGDTVSQVDLDIDFGQQNLVSFGEGLDGELYVLGLDGTLARIDPT